MDRTELKAKHPDLYNEIYGRGVSAERDRAAAHLIMGNASGDMETAIAAVTDGSEMTAVLNAKYMAAGMNKKDIEVRAEDDTDVAAGADDVNTDTAADTDAEGEKVASLVEAKFGIKKGGK